VRYVSSPWELLERKTGKTHWPEVPRKSQVNLLYPELQDSLASNSPPPQHRACIHKKCWGFGGLLPGQEVGEAGNGNGVYRDGGGCQSNWLLCPLHHNLLLLGLQLGAGSTLFTFLRKNARLALSLVPGTTLETLPIDVHSARGLGARALRTNPGFASTSARLGCDLPFSLASSRHQPGPAGIQQLQEAEGRVPPAAPLSGR
jgi:hypothetical protein